MAYFLQLIADYGSGDPAFSEVIQKLYALNPGIRVITTSVPPFSTVATGFLTLQFATVNPVEDMIIYTNTAPRKDDKNGRHKNEGEGLVYAKLKNDVRVVGVNAGYCFSFVKPQIQKLYHVNVANKGSQFRSRDFYPDAVAGILKGQNKWIGPSVSVDFIANAPDNLVAWIDGYGNIKTTTRVSQVKFSIGQPVVVTLNGMKRTAFYTDGTFSVREGELAFAPGSSGGEDPFMEIFLRGLSAWREFGKPHVEDEFEVTAI